MDNGPSARRLRIQLTADDNALRMLCTEAMFHTQVAWTCQLLDVVDEVADPATAAAVTDAICERLAGDGVAEAAGRLAVAQAQMTLLERGWSASSPLIAG